MEQEMDDLLFNLSCMDNSESLVHGEWYYYINSHELNENGDGAIWKVKKDGTGNQRVQKSNTTVCYLIGVDEHWIYFAGKLSDTEKSDNRAKAVFHGLGSDGVRYMKMTVRGSLERLMTETDEENWEEEMEELEERF